MPGTLYLIPNGLGGPPRDVLSASLKKALAEADFFAVESVDGALPLLKAAGVFKPGRTLFYKLSEGTEEPLRALNEGKNGGVISDAGCPAVADPGAELVLKAHQKNIRVVPLFGPSSILMALMASGLGGQSFAFCGYLPIEAAVREQKIRALEKSAQGGQTQIFIEAPHRNQALLEALLKTLRPQTLLCVAQDLTGAGESVRTLPVSQWKGKAPQLPKTPAIFLLGSA